MDHKTNQKGIMYYVSAKLHNGSVNIVKCQLMTSVETRECVGERIVRAYSNSNIYIIYVFATP